MKVTLWRTRMKWRWERAGLLPGGRTANFVVAFLCDILDHAWVYHPDYDRNICVRCKETGELLYRRYRPGHVCPACSGLDVERGTLINWDESKASQHTATCRKCGYAWGYSLRKDEG